MMLFNRVTSADRHGAKRSSDSMSARRLVRTWLVSCCVLIFLIVVLGGVTRLTGSGLSMVDWKPLSGVIPPLSAAAWQQEFENYQGSPQFQQVNASITLARFQAIFYFEYAHRLLGRIIGLAFIVPFLFLWWHRVIHPSLVPRLLVVFVLGGMQGLLGWYMVRSGLVDVPWVSPYRLTAHLGLAVVLYSYLWWLVLDHWRRGAMPGAATWHRRTGFALCALVMLTVLSGGFVAGLKAGHAFNTFPLMAGEWLPPGYWVIEPGWRNLFENIPTVQFNHRVLGVASFLGLMAFVGFAWRRTSSGYYRWLLGILGCAATFQVGLGIATLLMHVPIIVAALHQANALLLVTVSLCVAFSGRR